MDRIGTLLGRVAVLGEDDLQELEDLVLEEFHAAGSDATKAIGVHEAGTLESLAAAGRPSRQRSVARGRRRTSQGLQLDDTGRAVSRSCGRSRGPCPACCPARCSSSWGPWSPACG